MVFKNRFIRQFYIQVRFASHCYVIPFFLVSKMLKKNLDVSNLCRKNKVNKLNDVEVNFIANTTLIYLQLTICLEATCNVS